MQYQNGYQQYKEQSVNTMTQGEMLICLYDGAIKSLTKAKIYGNNKDSEKFVDEINHVREIVNYLDRILDRSYPISHALAKLYDFFNFELARASASL